MTTVPDDTDDLPLLALLHRATRWFDDELLDRLVAAGVAPITPAHTIVLAHLDDGGPDPTTAELARRAGVTRQTMHAAVTQLVGEGLLAVAPGAGFPRRSAVRLTAAGERRRDVALGVLRGLETELAAAIGAGAVSRLRRDLAAVGPATVRADASRSSGVRTE